MATDTSRTARNRRAKLESLRSSASVGPRIHGLEDTDAILVANFYNRRNCVRFRNALSARGISSSTKSNRIKVFVFVGSANRSRAFELLDEHRKDYPDKRPEGIRRDYDATFLCTLIGILVGIPLLRAWQDPVPILTWVGYIVSGLCVGSLLDRCRRNYNYFGRLQFSVAEFFGFTAVAAALIAFWSFVFR